MDDEPKNVVPTKKRKKNKVQKSMEPVLVEPESAEPKIDAPSTYVTHAELKEMEGRLKKNMNSVKGSLKYDLQEFLKKLKKTMDGVLPVAATKLPTLQIDSFEAFVEFDQQLISDSELNDNLVICKFSFFTIIYTKNEKFEVLLILYFVLILEKNDDPTSKRRRVL